MGPDLFFSGNLGVCPSLPLCRFGKRRLCRTLLVLHHDRDMLWLRCRFSGGDGEHGADKRWAVPLGFRVCAAVLPEDPIVRVWLDVDAGMAGVCGQQCLCLKCSKRRATQSCSRRRHTAPSDPYESTVVRVVAVFLSCPECPASSDRCEKHQ